MYHTPCILLILVHCFSIPSFIGSCSKSSCPYARKAVAVIQSQNIHDFTRRYCQIYSTFFSPSCAALEKARYGESHFPPGCRPHALHPVSSRCTMCWRIVSYPHIRWRTLCDLENNKMLHIIYDVYCFKFNGKVKTALLNGSVRVDRKLKVSKHE